MKLRAGFTTRDRRLDRLPVHDPRSRGYLVSRHPLVVGKLQRSYTWSCAQHLDQGQEGACVGFGVTHELICRPAVVKGLDAKFARERIYWEAQRNDEWAGGAYPGARPFYEGTSVTAGVKVAQKLGAMDSYVWAYALDALILGVGYAGPAVMGTDWKDGMFAPDEDGFIHATGAVAGGHCWLIKGVSLSRKAFRMHNSWGASWGQGGDAWISFADVSALLKAGGEACFFLGRHTKLKP